MNKEKLDTIALDIEFLLISVIQGVALAALAAVAIGPISNLQFQYWPYIVVAFLFILIFWSGAVIHAISFIDWPLDLTHSFLYFLASFLEVMVINSLTNPVWWFGFFLIFQVIAGVLYWYDLSMIKQREDHFKDTPSGQRLYKHIKEEQIMELKVFIPSSIIFNLAALLIIVYINPQLGTFLVMLQIIFALAFLTNSLKSFKTRVRLLSEKI